LSTLRGNPMSENASPVKEVTDETFGAETGGEGYCLVDFYATWCPHCKAFRPKFEQVASEFEGPVTFVAADVNECGGQAKVFGIRSIPSLVLLKSGQTVDTHVGGMEPDALKTWLKEKTAS
jgi:thioredoxin 1